MGEGLHLLCRHRWPAPYPSNEGSSEAVALLGPGVRVVVVAVALPEPRAVDRRELDPAQPLRALPEVLAGNHEPKGVAVVRRQRLPVAVRREQRVLLLE